MKRFLVLFTVQLTLSAASWGAESICELKKELANGIRSKSETPVGVVVTLSKSDSRFEQVMIPNTIKSPVAKDALNLIQNKYGFLFKTDPRFDYCGLCAMLNRPDSTTAAGRPIYDKTSNLCFLGDKQPYWAFYSTDLDDNEWEYVQDHDVSDLPMKPGDVIGFVWTTGDLKPPAMIDCMSVREKYDE